MRIWNTASLKTPEEIMYQSVQERHYISFSTIVVREVQRIVISGVNGGTFALVGASSNPITVTNSNLNPLYDALHILFPNCWTFVLILFLGVCWHVYDHFLNVFLRYLYWCSFSHSAFFFLTFLWYCCILSWGITISRSSYWSAIFRDRWSAVRAFVNNTVSYNITFGCATYAPYKLLAIQNIDLKVNGTLDFQVTRLQLPSTPLQGLRK